MLCPSLGLDLTTPALGPAEQKESPATVILLRGFSLWRGYTALWAYMDYSRNGGVLMRDSYSKHTQCLKIAERGRQIVKSLINNKILSFINLLNCIQTSGDYNNISMLICISNLYNHYQI